MRKLKILLTMFALCLLSACTEDNLYTTAYPCSFLFRGDYHSDCILNRVVDNPGMFVKVTVTSKLGVPTLNISPNTGDATEEIMLTTEIESRFDYSNVGADNSIILGCTVTGDLKAYDAQCPYCLESNSGTDYSLTWTNNGNSVVCDNCSRTYNLNYDGISDDGNRLLQYKMRVTAATVGKIITVSNG